MCPPVAVSARTPTPGIVGDVAASRRRLQLDFRLVAGEGVDMMCCSHTGRFTPAGVSPATGSSEGVAASPDSNISQPSKKVRMSTRCLPTSFRSRSPARLHGSAIASVHGSSSSSLNSTGNILGPVMPTPSTLVFVAATREFEVFQPSMTSGAADADNDVEDI